MSVKNQNQTCKYFFDTNIISYFISGRNLGLNKKILEIPNENRFINWVVQEEILYGVFKKNRIDLELKYRDFFEVCNIVQSNAEIVEICAKLESHLSTRGLSTQLEDLWVASTCIVNDFVLVTNNEKHFKNINSLKVENWVLD
jgi:predicted nucleic acid-binding protein